MPPRSVLKAALYVGFRCESRAGACCWGRTLAVLQIGISR